MMKAWGALWGSAPLLWAGEHAEGTEGSELVWILEYSTRPSREATSWSRRTWRITHTEQSLDRAALEVHGEEPHLPCS